MSLRARIEARAEDWRQRHGDRAAALGARWVAKPFFALPLDWRVHRAALGMAARLTPKLSGVRETWETVGGVPCRVSEPEGGGAGDLLWLHGGGFVVGSARSYHRLLDSLALATGRRVTAPDYRLAPEHPFPAAYDDCLAALRARTGALGGDSAGGTLALAVAATLCREGRPPERLVLASPAADLDPARPVPADRREMVLPLNMIRRATRAYRADADPRDPRLSPIHADWPCTVATQVFVAEGELLEHDADAIAERLRAAGADVDLRRYRGVPHAWVIGASRAPAADRAVAEIALFLGGAP